MVRLEEHPNAFINERAMTMRKYGDVLKSVFVLFWLIFGSAPVMADNYRIVEGEGAR